MKENDGEKEREKGYGSKGNRSQRSYLFYFVRGKNSSRVESNDKRKKKKNFKKQEQGPKNC